MSGSGSSGPAEAASGVHTLSSPDRRALLLGLALLLLLGLLRGVRGGGASALRKRGH